MLFIFPMSMVYVHLRHFMKFTKKIESEGKLTLSTYDTTGDMYASLKELMTTLTIHISPTVWNIIPESIIGGAAYDAVTHSVKILQNLVFPKRKGVDLGKGPSVGVNINRDNKVLANVLLEDLPPELAEKAIQQAIEMVENIVVQDMIMEYILKYDISKGEWQKEELLEMIKRTREKK